MYRVSKGKKKRERRNFMFMGLIFLPPSSIFSPSLPPPSLSLAPNSPNYGKHLSHQAISELISPPKEDVAYIRDWLLSHEEIMEEDIEVIPRGDWIRLRATFSTVEKLLQCRFSIFHHVNSNTRITRTRAYSLPLSISKVFLFLLLLLPAFFFLLSSFFFPLSSLFFLLSSSPSQFHQVVSFVGGTVRFPKIQKKIINKSSKLSADANVTPAVIKAHYNVTDEGSSSSNLQSVNQFLEQYYSPNDLADFFKRFSLPDNTVSQVVGPNKPNDPGDEVTKNKRPFLHAFFLTPLLFSSLLFSSLLFSSLLFSSLSSLSQGIFGHSIHYGSRNQCSYLVRLHCRK
jgi:hypothetical protein